MESKPIKDWIPEFPVLHRWIIPVNKKVVKHHKTEVFDLHSLLRFKYCSSKHWRRSWSLPDQERKAATMAILLDKKRDSLSSLWRNNNNTHTYTQRRNTMFPTNSGIVLFSMSRFPLQALKASHKGSNIKQSHGRSIKDLFEFTQIIQWLKGLRRLSLLSHPQASHAGAEPLRQQNDAELTTSSTHSVAIIGARRTVNRGKCQNTISLFSVQQWHSSCAPRPTHSLELPFSRVCVVTVVKVRERRQDLLEKWTHQKRQVG